MCGIVGYVGKQQAAPILLDGLSKLEYRGYDSAGLCVRDGDQPAIVVKAVGKLTNLYNKVDSGRALHGTCGIGHTRWATHGEPSLTNAHPHVSGNCTGSGSGPVESEVVGVHNGIIENYQQLKDKMIRHGYRFYSDTDTEVLIKLVDYYYKKYKMGPIDALAKTMVRVRGSYALEVMFTDHPGEIYTARKDAPMIIGQGDGEMFVASDVPAILSHTRKVYYIDNLEMAKVTADGVTFYNLDGDVVPKQPTEVQMDAKAAEKGGYPHFMLKEIHEQPKVVGDTLRRYVEEAEDSAEEQGPSAADSDSREEKAVGMASEEKPVSAAVSQAEQAGGDSAGPAGQNQAEQDQKHYRINFTDLGLSEEYVKNLTQVYFVACGSAWHVAMETQYVMEEFADIPVRCELASEFRYRKARILDDPKKNATKLVIIISQSGETADSLAALRMAKEKGMRTLAIVNVVGSSIAREADHVMYTLAGPEISVATTKAYSCQLICGFLLSIYFGQVRGFLSESQASHYINELMTIPDKIEKILDNKERIQWFATKLVNSKDIFFIGRGIDYAICLEGSLKMKEISYIHSEAYAAGELKHGTISLIEDKTLVIGCLTQSDLYEKTISNMVECKSRGAYLMGITENGKFDVEDQVNFAVYVPRIDEHFIGSLAIIPLQLLGYYTSVAKGLDVDKPRNLAKSVTVE